jgi:hypothetical protein
VNRPLAAVLGGWFSDLRKRLFLVEVITCWGQDIERQQFARDPVWTESTAVKSESFISSIAREIRNREELDLSVDHGVGWVLKETGTEYTTGHLNDTR